jgi:catechol 2,3-dioxygenase-like lactoylglutathione lyase family enzyme
MLKLHHISIAVNDVEKALEAYKDMLGLNETGEGIKEFPEFGVRAAFLSSEDGTGFRMELAEPMPGTGVRYGVATRDFLQERGEGLFRFALFTDEFDARVKALQEKGYPMIIENYHSLFPGHTVRIAFFPLKDSRGVWMNLVDARTVPKSSEGLAPQ